MSYIRNSLLATLALTSLVASAEMTFRSIPNNATTFIYAEGEITKDSPRKLQAHLKTIEEGIPVVVFNSPGGNLFAGLAMGEILRKGRYASTVGEWRFTDRGNYIDKEEVGPGQCMSACALAFMGGAKREIGGFDGKRGALGFHQFYGELKVSGAELLSSAQIVSALISEYLRVMGAHPSLFEALSRTGPNEIFVPNTRQLVDMNITSPTSFRRFTLEPRMGQIVARAELRENAEGFQRVAHVEAACLGKMPVLRLYSDPGRGLTADFVRNGASFLRVSITAGGRTVERGPEAFQLHSNSQLVATVGLDRAQANALSRGPGGVSFNSPSASGVLIGAAIGESGSYEPALEAIFNNCQ